MHTRFLVIPILLISIAATAQNSVRVQVRLVTDEADAVLAILADRKANAAVSDAAWQRLFDSEGYRRLKQREASMKRAFTDDDFKKFVLSDELLQRAAALGQTLKKWQQADITRPAGLALAYLPAEANIHAAIYPVIKPLKNSFVFDVKSGDVKSGEVQTGDVQTGPAIFLYLDPDVSREKFENTVAHELHHIGYGTCCPLKETAALLTAQPEQVRTVAKWIGAFGEGFAMLAAAGGADVHPHAVSKAEDRKRWDHDVAGFAKDQQELDVFFRKILSGKLNTEQADEQAYTYFGVQGPWYTVGWKMAVTIEKVYGRPRLIQAMCNTSDLLKLYNQAAQEVAKPGGEPLPLWSPEVLKALQPQP